MTIEKGLKWSPLAPPSIAQLVGWATKVKKVKAKSPKPMKEPITIMAKNEETTSLKESKKRKLPSTPVITPQILPSVIPTPLPIPLQLASPVVSEKGDATIVWTGSDATLSWSDPTTRMCLIGRASIQLMKGKIDLMGYHVTLMEINTVESPSWTSALTMTCLEEGTELRIQSLHGQGTEKTFRLCLPAETRPTLLPPTWISAVNIVIKDWSTTKDLSIIDVNTSGRAARLLICGAKGVGKSTCLRYAINRLLAVTDSVMVLDCDAGQPEFSPPGLLTLTEIQHPVLSPPHLHMATKHVGASFFGQTTSKADPTLYLSMITALLQQYTDMVNERHAGNETKLPLLINTDGWVKGLGSHILTTLLDIVQPDHVIQILGDHKSKQFDLPALITTQQQQKRHVVRAYNNVDAPTDLGTSLSIPSPSYRSLRLCTYFLQDKTIWDNIDFGQFGIIDDDNVIAQELAAAKPIVVSIDLLQLVWRGEPADNCTAMLDALPGAVVGLCQGTYCWGLGIVRSIDYEKRLLYVLTPVAMINLTTVDTIVGGGIQLGRECFYQGVHSESFPYLTCDGVTAGIGGDVMKSRNNITRKAHSNVL